MGGTTDDGPAPLTFGLLGPVEVRRGDRVVDVGGPQQRAVLALLALDAGRVVPVDRLIARLWGEEPPVSAIGTLQSYVSRLRRALEPTRRTGDVAQLLASEAPGYRLQVPREAVDVFRFEALAGAGRAAAAERDPATAVECFDAALALWRGPALGGTGADQALQPVAARLEEERLTVVEDRFDAVLALGRHAAAIGSLQEAVEEHPLRERLWAQLALALYRNGRQADALRALATARATLADELGLDPGPELRRLEAQILAHDPALVVTPPPAARPAAPEHPSPAALAPLVGRTREWAALAAATGVVSAGQSKVVLVEGEPGIGKTALLSALAADATERGWGTVWGRGVEDGLAPALWPWVEVLRTALDLLPAAGRATVLDAQPAIRSVLDGGAGGDESSASPVELAEAVVAVLGAATGRAPLLVVLDDLHWADSASLALLPLVAERLGATPILLAAAHRPLDLGGGGPLAGALASLARLPGLTRLSPAALAPDDVAEVLRSLTGEDPKDDVVRRVLERSGGNPLFVGELARLLVSEGGTRGTEVPDAVRDVVRRRLARLPSRTNDLLLVAAVLGDEVDLRVLAAAHGQPVDACLDDLDPAVVTRILVPGEAGRFRFTHALVRDAVRSDLSPLRLARLHRQAADAIDAVYGADPDHAEPIAAHRWAAAGVDDPLRVTDALLRAGAVARRRMAVDAAEELLDRALEAARSLPPGPARTAREVRACEFLLHLETIRSFMGGSVEGLASRLEAIGHRNNSDEALALALFTRWSVLNQGAYAEGERQVAAARDLAAHTTSEYALIIAHYMAAVQAFLTGRCQEAMADFHAALALRGENGYPGDEHYGRRIPPVSLLGVAAIGAALAGDQALADSLGERAVRYGRGGTPATLTDTCFMLGLTEAARARPADALRYAELGLGPLAANVPHLQPSLRIVRAWALVVGAGDERYVDDGAAALVELDAGTTTVGVPMLRSLHGAARLVLGDLDGAEAALRRAQGQAEELGEVFWLPEILRLLAETRRAAGADTGEVGALLAAAVALAEAQGEPVLAAWARTSRQRPAIIPAPAPS